MNRNFQPNLSNQKETTFWCSGQNCLLGGLEKTCLAHGHRDSSRDLKAIAAFVIDLHDGNVQDRFSRKQPTIFTSIAATLFTFIIAMFQYFIILRQWMQSAAKSPLASVFRVARIQSTLRIMFPIFEEILYSFLILVVRALVITKFLQIQRAAVTPGSEIRDIGGVDDARYLRCVGDMHFERIQYVEPQLVVNSVHLRDTNFHLVTHVAFSLVFHVKSAFMWRVGALTKRNVNF